MHRGVFFEFEVFEVLKYFVFVFTFFFAPFQFFFCHAAFHLRFCSFPPSCHMPGIRASPPQETCQSLLAHPPASPCRRCSSSSSLRPLPPPPTNRRPAPPPRVDPWPTAAAPWRPADLLFDRLPWPNLFSHATLPLFLKAVRGASHPEFLGNFRVLRSFRAIFPQSDLSYLV